MSITGIMTAAAVVGVVGIFVGLFLGVAGIRFKVQVDEKEEEDDPAATVIVDEELSVIGETSAVATASLVSVSRAIVNSVNIY